MWFQPSGRRTTVRVAGVEDVDLAEGVEGIERRQDAEEEVQRPEALGRVPVDRPVGVLLQDAPHGRLFSQRQAGERHGKPPPVATGFTVSATELIALASEPESGTVPRLIGSAV